MANKCFELLLTCFPDPHPKSIVGKDLQSLYVLGRFPGHLSVHAAGIIPNHAPERAMVMGGWIWPEYEAVLPGFAAKIIENAAGLDAAEFFFPVHVQHAPHILGHVNHNSDVAALPREAGPAAPVEHGHFVPTANSHRAHDIFFVARDYNTDWHLAIVGSIGGVERPAPVVESNFAPNERFQLQFKTTYIRRQATLGRLHFPGVRAAAALELVIVTDLNQHD